ncbi:Trp biosynthesis-associated membrane protein [Microbacterium sp. 2FI]|uniref:Trp biosynthesis-associated membrane protein n=1 Tax=Microbacterium sp. 2FI TaxID=2502193 RepID=UPI0010F8D1D2|nr:Trp biosynthesis-associated membrane protein [Microbacterium sp. 2FI]
MMRRARLIAVVATLAAGALGVISSTQTWLTVILADGAATVIAVPGASAVAVLAPLSLAVLALGGALSIVGRVLRYVFGGLSVLIAGILAWLTAPVVIEAPTSAYAAAVTESTGIAGESAVTLLVAGVTTTPWPAITLVAWGVLFAAGVLTLITARRWRGSDRRYRTTATVDAGAAGAGAAEGGRPHDAAKDRAIDSWDDLSRGEDPTARPLD